ncbi:MAG: AMP-binding protein [Bacteroidales bacterium]|nr:AMP-binding protein [Candidatus Liminaster caballi]
MKARLNAVLEESIRQNWDLPALSNYQGETFTYGQVAQQIARYHQIWQEKGLKPGFRIALCGRPSAQWSIALLAAFTYRAVAVPLLNEFTAETVERLVAHSESEIVLLQPDLVTLTDCPELTPEDVHYERHTPDELLMINYTSGTTSDPKGVMIPERALWSNMAFAQQVLPNLHAGQSVLSLLPTAHLYGMSFELMYEFCTGIHITFLNRALTPTLIMAALKDVKPIILVLVPMLIEKIVRKGLMPQFKDPKISAMRRIPFLRNTINRKMREGLMEALGGNLYEVIIGGAALNSEVEEVLKEIDFPYTVGYGMTECAPIIGYEDWKDFVRNSCGKAAPRMEVHIDSTDPHNVPGEILTRGMNVMLGYYKNEEATRRTIDADGWLHTGDMGVIDTVGNIFIRGRIKNMLLSGTGQNIYPEEIEAEVNSLPFVVESVVVQRDLRLVALTYPDREAAAKAGFKDDEALLRHYNSLMRDMNHRLPAYAHVNAFELVEQEFEKTPKKSIKRFLYS